MSSDPITVVINVADVNDNSPTLVFPEKTVKIQDARILEPFLIKVGYSSPTSLLKYFIDQ